VSRFERIGKISSVPRPPAAFAQFEKCATHPCLPSMEGFRVRREVANNPKAQAVYRDVNDWCADLIKIAGFEGNRIGKHEGKSKANDADMPYQETIAIAHAVRDRCAHTIIHPELYDYKNRDVESYVYWFWTTCAQLTNKEGGRYIDHEYYVPKLGVFSRFFTQASRFESENQNRSFEFYNFLSRFANAFPFAYPEDQMVFEMYVDGYDKKIIAYLVKREVTWVIDKLKYYIEIALDNLDKFYENSRADADKMIEELENE
jgi:hypothetical protein